MSSPEIVWFGPEKLREHLRPITDLNRHPANPRRGQVSLIAESLARFGQVRPLLLDDHVIVAGNHTYLAATELGWTHVAAVPNEWADSGEAAAYLLADNRLPELGDYDREILLAHLEDVATAGTWEGTGYDLDALDDLRALHGQMPETAPVPFEGGYAADPEELAAREARLAAGNTYRELVLTLSADASAQFETHVKILRKEYALQGVAEVVARALAEQAAAA